MKLRVFTMQKLKVYATLILDPEEYPMPADENPTEEVEESITDFFHEVEGISIKHIKVTME